MGQGQACRCRTPSLQPEWVLPPTIQLCTDCMLTCYIFKKGLGERQTNPGFLGNTGGRKIWWKFRSSNEENSAAAAAAKLHQSCPTLCDPIDGSPPGSPVPGILPGKNTGVGCHFLLQCMKVKSESEVAQSCLTLHDPMDCSQPGSSIHGIFQARVLELGAIAFSRRKF